MTTGFTIATADYARDQARLHALREAVFVHEQHVPPDLERDALDPDSHHVMALAADGSVLGTARLTPEQRIGRMAVLAQARGHGIGRALLDALLAEAARRDWAQVTLHAQAHALPFYARAGFVPCGPAFQEAGIEHRHMCQRLRGPTPFADADGAAAVLLALADGARRDLGMFSHHLDPGLLDRSDVLEALRRFATRSGERRVRILLQDAATPQRDDAPLLTLAQRLPSTFSFRQVEDPVDTGYRAAYAFSDTGGMSFRPLGDRFQGEGGRRVPVPARRLQREFERAWERSRPCVEYRALR